LFLVLHKIHSQVSSLHKYNMHKAKGASMGEMGFHNDDRTMKIYEQWQAHIEKSPRQLREVGLWVVQGRIRL